MCKDKQLTEISDTEKLNELSDEEKFKKMSTDEWMELLFGSGDVEDWKYNFVYTDGDDVDTNKNSNE